MADNITLNSGSGGSNIATDDDGAAHHQYVKVEFGADDTQTKVTASAGLPVTDDGSFTLAANSGVDIGDVDVTSVAPGSGASSLGKAEDAAHSSGDVGVLSLAVRRSADTPTSGTDGDYEPLKTDANGHLKVEIFDGGDSHTVDGTVTANLSATDNAVLDTIDAVLDAINAKLVTGTVIGDVNLGATDNAVLDAIQTAVELIDNAISGSEMQVDVVAALPAGTNVIGDVGISGARTSGGTTLYKNIDVDESEDAVKASAGQVYWIHAMNLSSAVKYLKLYNATVATVVVGTTVPDLTFPLATQGDTNGAGFTLSIPNGIAFGTAITIAATTGVADADSGAPGANEVVVNLGYA